MIGDWTPPSGAVALLEVEVGGKHVPAGSKNGNAVRFKDERGKWKVKIVTDKDGNEHAQVTVSDVNASKLKKRAGEIQAAVLEVAREVGFTMPHKDTPVAVACTFFRPRPATTQYGSGRNARVLKDSAPAYPVAAPDATKLWRGFEDALTGVLWHDDARVVGQVIGEDYVEHWEDPLTCFALYSLPATVAARRAAEGKLPTDVQDSLLATP